MTSSWDAAESGAAQSLVWRCRLCGRLHLFVEPTRRPAACHDCGGVSFDRSAGTPSSSSTASFDTQDGELDGPHGAH